MENQEESVVVATRIPASLRDRVLDRATQHERTIGQELRKLLREVYAPRTEAPRP